MSNERQLILSQTRVGRIQLHLLAFFFDYHFRFHFNGIKREILKTIT